jgi:hypothetical protein
MGAIAFINYSRREDAQRAIDALNGHGYGHLILRVEVISFFLIARLSLVFIRCVTINNSGLNHVKNVKKVAVVKNVNVTVKVLHHHEVALVAHGGCKLMWSFSLAYHQH